MQPKPIKKASPSQAILCINRTKKSIHVRIYKLARIWSMKNIPVLATEETTRSTTINYATENAVLSLCSMNIAKNLLPKKCSVTDTFHYSNVIPSYLPQTNSHVHRCQNLIATVSPHLITLVKDH